MATFLAHYLKDQGAPPASEALTFRTGANEWTATRRVAAGEERHAATPVFPGGRQARLHRAAGGEGSGVRLVPLRPAQPGSLSPAADHARPRLVHLAGRRSAVRARASGRAHLRDRSAHRTGRRRGSDQRASVCRHQRHRQRLDREADRRLSREVRRRDDAWIPADDCRRRDPRPVSQEHREARRADAERSRSST